MNNYEYAVFWLRRFFNVNMNVTANPRKTLPKFMFLYWLSLSSNADYNSPPRHRTIRKAARLTIMMMICIFEQGRAGSDKTATLPDIYDREIF
jgi:hypothetical protein